MKNLILFLTIICWFACGQAQTQENEESSVVDSLETEEIAVKESPHTFEFKQNKNKYPQNYFRNPFDSAILLSGSFCELRNNHFHGGLDIRTGGIQGWKVLSAAKGYVSRIKVSPYGYGKAIYVTHPNGYTSVYGHLKSFNENIEAYIEKAQYNQRSYEIELFPKAGALNLEKGEMLALSGNTGGSGGPHLHFEIRDASGQAVNPLLFGLEVQDQIEPRIVQLMLYLRDNQSLIEQGGYPWKKLKKSSPYLNGTALKVVPGTYSLGLLSKDFFTDTRYRLGINYCWVTANDELLYQYQIECMDFTKGRYINTHLDYYLKSTTGVNYIRLFQEPFNPYPYYKQNQRAEVYLRQGDSSVLRVYVQDLAGMRDSVHLLLVGDSSGQRLQWTASHSYDTLFRVVKGKTNHLSYGIWKMSLANANFYHDFDLKLRNKQRRAGALVPSLQLHYPYTPLHSHIKISVALDKDLLKYGKQLCAISYGGDRKVYEGGSISNNRLHFKTRSFGEYSLAVDSVAPRIVLERLSRNLRFRISDNLSGIKSYQVSIDDQWILMEYEPKLSLLFGTVPDWIKTGKHQLKIVVTDDRGNQKKIEREITL